MAQRQWRSDDTDAWLEGFGSGGDGSSYNVPANEGCSGTLASKTLTLASAGGFANDQLILIHQTRGTNAGAWELNKIVSGGGTTTLTLKYDLTLTYTDSGANQAQVIQMRSYDGLSLTSTTTTPVWDGSKGGIIAFFDIGSVTGSSATISLDGSQPTSATRVTGGGFRGGAGGSGSGTSTQGEGHSADGGASTAANTTGGGGGSVTVGLASGGGGGYATGGTNGGTDGGTGGTGGGTVGVASLTSIYFGGAGGGARRDSSSQPAGSNGGGIAFIFASDIDLTSIQINCRGAAGYSAAAPGGAGAGGSVLLKCQTATLGTNKILATGGAATASTSKPFSGGAGGVGRIHIDYSTSFTGTTNPTIDSTLDTTIVPTGGSTGNFLPFFM